MLEKYLPIGTIVVLNNGNKKLMITGFCTATGDQPDLVYDYTGCLYPEGIVSTDRVLLFNHSDINQIFFVGYSDQEQQNFIARLKDLMNPANIGMFVEDAKNDFKQPELTALPQDPNTESELMDFFIN